jgi:hypothetical protein
MASRRRSKLRFLHALAAVLILPLAALTISPAAARYHETCWVNVLHDYDRWDDHTHQWVHYSAWSGVTAAKCNYLTGMELNDRIRQQMYVDDFVYVLIIWPDRTRNIIQIGGMFFCGSVAEAGCVEVLSGVISGQEEWPDQYGRRPVRYWKICQSGIFEQDCYQVLR